MSAGGAGAPRVDRPYIADGYGIPESLEGTLPWSWAQERLLEARVYWVATVRPDGRPHVTPIWGIWVDDVFWMEGSANTRRFRNLRSNPAAVVTLERGNDAIIVEGQADLVRELDERLTQRLLAGYTKYISSHGYEADPANWREGIWRVRPQKVLGWSNFPADTTRWRFDQPMGA